MITRSSDLGTSVDKKCGGSQYMESSHEKAIADWVVRSEDEKVLGQ